MSYTIEQVEQAKNLKFQCWELNGELTVGEWLKKLLTTLIQEEEGFSGKRPFGNSGWKSPVEAALIQAGLVKGKLDSDGCVDECENIDPLLYAIINTWK